VDSRASIYKIDFFLPSFDLGVIALLNELELDKLLISLCEISIFFITFFLPLFIVADLALNLLDGLVDLVVSHAGYLPFHGLELSVHFLLLLDPVLDHLLLLHQLLVFSFELFLLLDSLLATAHL
jgi:hypothetical protein